MKNNNVLISGAGIGGPALAYWLLQFGFTPTLVERAPALRTGGYMIDFWGVGWDVAERMGVLPRLVSAEYQVENVLLVNDAGATVARLDGNVYRTATKGQFTSILRSDLARAIYSLIDGRVETIFGDTVQRLEQDPNGVHVVFEHASPRRFDLVIGADGLHSTVRALAFGEEGKFERYLGYRTASFTASNYPNRDENCIYRSYCAPGRQVARYSIRGDRTAFFFVFVDENRVGIAHTRQEQMMELRRVYENAGWECPLVLDAMESADDLYFDAVSQIHMDHWSNGRVALVGDAAFCPSLLAGQGSGIRDGGGVPSCGRIACCKRRPRTRVCRVSVQVQTIRR